MPSSSLQTNDIHDIVSFFDRVRTLDFIDKALFDSIGEQLTIQTQERYEQEIDPDGNDWVELSEKYAKRKAKKATHNKILQFSGQLLDTLSYNSTDYGLKFGSNKIYAATQHFGRDDIHARPFLGINEDDKKAITEEVIASWDIWFSKQG